MRVTLLGTGTPAPSPKRMSSGYVVEVGGDMLVFDHGPWAHHRLLESGRRAVDVTPRLPDALARPAAIISTPRRWRGRRESRLSS